MKSKKEHINEFFKEKNVLTLANKITVIRILLIPVIVILLLKRLMLSAFLLIGLTSLTDLLDGLAARLKSERTQLGAFLDPLADKLLLTSVYFTLTFLDVIEVWVFVVVFSRDLLIVLGWGILYILTGSSKILPRVLGKVTTAVQMVAALIFISPYGAPYQNYLLWFIVLFTIASVIDYVLVAERRLGQWG